MAYSPIKHSNTSAHGAAQQIGDANMKTYRTFPTWQAACEYRTLNGTGGFVFVPVTDKALGDEAILFPVGMTASQIFNHPLTRGLSGELV